MSGGKRHWFSRLAWNWSGGIVVRTAALYFFTGVIGSYARASWKIIFSPVIMAADLDVGELFGVLPELYEIQYDSGTLNTTENPYL